MTLQALRQFDRILLTLQTHLQSQRALLLQGTESLNNATQSIQRSQQIANETEQIGNDIIEELGEQREQLDRTRNRVRILAGSYLCSVLWLSFIGAFFLLLFAVG